jgi:hypothetical protein
MTVVVVRYDAYPVLHATFIYDPRSGVVTRVS